MRLWNRNSCSSGQTWAYFLSSIIQCLKSGACATEVRTALKEIAPSFGSAIHVGWSIMLRNTGSQLWQWSLVLSGTRRPILERSRGTVRSRSSALLSDMLLAWLPTTSLFRHMIIHAVMYCSDVLHCALYSCVQCIVIGPVCVWVCYHDRLTRNCVHRSSLNWVYRWRQWPSPAD